MDERRLFFFTGDPTNELGVSQESVLRREDILSIVGDITFGSLSIGWRTDRLRWACGVWDSGEGGDRRFRLTLASLSGDSEYNGDFSIRREALIGEEDGESTVEISTSRLFDATFMRTARLGDW